jgi:large exoprotein involved in heme utilization and adhesion
MVASAVQGRGGNIEITTQGILGLKYRDRLTPDNDITASSEFGVNGTVQVNNIGVDPASGLLEFPVEIVDPNQQVAQSCATDQGSRFIVTGRGGVPKNPSQYLSPDRSWSDLRTIGTQSKDSISQSLNSPLLLPLIEATNWQRNANGVVEILESVPHSAAPQTMVTCAPH